MNFHFHKNRTRSRHSGQRYNVGIQRRDIPKSESSNVATLDPSVTMFPRGVQSYLCQHRDVETQHRDVETQHRDVTESWFFQFTSTS